MAKKRKGNSVRDLLGAKSFTKYGLKTKKGELLFYTVSPTNISVLSYVNIEIKIRHLMMVLSSVPDIEICCTDSTECFDDNKSYLKARLDVEDNSMCVGAESKYFNGHTNIKDSNFLVFGVKGLLETNKRLKDTMLFNILSFMSNQLLGEGHTAASIDELYLFLTNMTAIEYIRNAMKRVRKKESSIILASQNIEDFLIPSIREFTKPCSQSQLTSSCLTQDRSIPRSIWTL